MTAPFLDVTTCIDGTRDRHYCSSAVRAGDALRPERIRMEMLKRFGLLFAGLAAIVLGFLTLAGGMLSVGPLLLVGGYCVLLPFFLWRSFRNSVGE